MPVTGFVGTTPHIHQPTSPSPTNTAAITHRCFPVEAMSATKVTRTIIVAAPSLQSCSLNAASMKRMARVSQTRSNTKNRFTLLSFFLSLFLQSPPNDAPFRLKKLFGRGISTGTLLTDRYTASSEKPPRGALPRMDKLTKLCHPESCLSADRYFRI